MPHTAPTGRETRFSGVASLPWPQNRKQGHTGANWGFLPRTNIPLPLKGEGLGIACLGFVGGALLLHNWVTLVQQGLSGAALVSFPHLALKTAHRASHGLFLLCLIFSPTGKGWADLAPVLLRLTQICPQLPHTPSTGQVTDFGGVVSLPGFQNRTQGLTGPSLALTVFS